MTFYILTMKQGRRFNEIHRNLRDKEDKASEAVSRELGYDPFTTARPLTKKEKSVILKHFQIPQTVMGLLLGTFQHAQERTRDPLLREGVTYLSRIGEEEGYVADIRLTEYASYNAVRQWYIFKKDGKWYYKTDVDSDQSYRVR